MSITRRTPFRANEAAAAGREDAIHRYTRGFKEASERKEVATYIDRLIEKYGPVVQGYPSWHPFTVVPKEDESKQLDPRIEPRGFEGLDHTIYFREAFITAPYGGADRVIQSAQNRRHIQAEEIRDVRLYCYETTPVLVTCTPLPKEDDGTIYKRFALAQMLLSELPSWSWAQCGEPWEYMRPYILGTPCGSRSSLFLNQDSGKALREVLEMLNRHELFGPTQC